jgi:LysM repeat protein
MTARVVRLLGALGGMALIGIMVFIAVDLIPTGPRPGIAGVTSVRPEPVAVSTPTPTVRRYVAKHGDTLARIARKFHIPLTLLLRANNFTRHFVVKPGQEMIIPPAGGSAPEPIIPGEPLVGSPFGPFPPASSQPTSPPGLRSTSPSARQKPSAPAGSSHSHWSWLSYVVVGAAGLAVECTAVLFLPLRVKRVSANSCGSHAGAVPGKDPGGQRGVADPRRGEPPAPSGGGRGHSSAPLPERERMGEQPRAQPAGDRPAVLTMVSGAVEVQLIDGAADGARREGLPELGRAHTTIDPMGYAIFDGEILVPVQICGSRHHLLLPGQEIRLHG